MGLMESSPEDSKKYGLRIYTIIKNGPLDKGGAKELTDFIIPPYEIYNNQINFQDWVKSHANQEITLSLYSLLTKKFREIKIITNPLGSKDGILGVSVKKENWTIANKNALHIISVKENSFAQKELGLTPLDDYIIGVKSKTTSIIPLNQDDFSPLEIMGEVIRKNKGKLIKFYIYNKKKGARDVTVTIGEDYYFSLGCEGAFGTLHMFPSLETNVNKIENNIQENKVEEGEKKEEIKKEKKPYDPRLYDTEKMELVDYGEHSYQKLLDSISHMNGIMWLGKLSPSKCENMFDNYIKIINKINERKKELKDKFEEEQATEEKKLLETDLKARKQLLNIFLKGKSTYEVIRDNYKLIQTGQANPDELGDEEEGGQDEEQFSHDMHVLIDYYIDDDFELINSILRGKHIHGFYGLDKGELIDKEEEFDPKTIEDIIN